MMYRQVDESSCTCHLLSFRHIPFYWSHPTVTRARYRCHMSSGGFEPTDLRLRRPVLYPLSYEDLKKLRICLANTTRPLLWNRPSCQSRISVYSYELASPDAIK